MDTPSTRLKGRLESFPLQGIAIWYQQLDKLTSYSLGHILLIEF